LSIHATADHELNSKVHLHKLMSMVTTLAADWPVALAVGCKAWRVANCAGCLFMLQLGADLVSLFTGLDKSVTKECGNGYISGGMANGADRFAVSIIAAGCWDGYTLAHEVCTG
jgi:hypothetical protein